MVDYKLFDGEGHGVAKLKMYEDGQTREAVASVVSQYNASGCGPTTTLAVLLRENRRADPQLFKDPLFSIFVAS